MSRRLGVEEAQAVEGRRVTLRCPWLGCSSEIVAYRSQIFEDLGRGRLRTGRKHLFCAEHRELVRRITGDSRMNGFGRVFANPERVYAARTAEPLALRVAVFAQHDERCGGCRLPLIFAERGKTWWIDHVVPVYKGGLTTLRNLMPLCGRCHRAKTAVEIREVRQTRPNTSGRQWLTHAQKDQIIAGLRAEIARLTGCA